MCTIQVFNKNQWVTPHLNFQKVLPFLDQPFTCLLFLSLVQVFWGFLMCVDYLISLLDHIYALTCTTHFHFQCITHVIILNTIDCTSKLIVTKTTKWWFFTIPWPLVIVLMLNTNNFKHWICTCTKQIGKMKLKQSY